MQAPCRPTSMISCITVESCRRWPGSCRGSCSSSGGGTNPSMSGRVDGGICATAFAIAWSTAKPPAPSVLVVRPGRPCRSLRRRSRRAAGERARRRSGACRTRRLVPGASRASPPARSTGRGGGARARRRRRPAGPCPRRRRAAWRGLRPARGRRPGRAGGRPGSAAGASGAGCCVSAAAPSSAQVLRSSALQCFPPCW